MGHIRNKIGAERELMDVGYPHVVLRLMPGVYGRRRVIFSPVGKTRFDGRDFIFVNFDARHGFRELHNVIRDAARMLKLRMCLVNSPVDCLYFEPDGTVERSDDPPSGGITLGGNMKIGLYNGWDNS